MSIRHCLTLDLVNDPEAIKQYIHYHHPDQVWPEIIKSITDADVEDMEIYLFGNRLFMILEVNEKFSFDKKAKMDLENEIVVRWENLMQEKFQQALPGQQSIQWMKMERIFKLTEAVKR